MRIIIESIELIIGILIGVAYITLSERKVMASMQRRIGPDKVGIYGIIQPIADGVKLFIKEILIPQQVDKRYYIFGPIFIFLFSIIIWIPLPINNFKGILLSLPYSILYFLAISSLSSYILLYTGWSSNNRYTIIGALRGVNQIMAYEVGIGIILMNVIVLAQSFNLLDILYSQIEIPYLFPLFPISLLFLISAIAETSRPPFDLTESESELVAGVLTEYGGLAFAYLYLAEYSFIFSMSLISSILFLGNTVWTIGIIFIFIWVRVALPRLRFDQLLNLGWNRLLPISISYLGWIISMSLVI